jgi:hypothetical protein
LFSMGEERGGRRERDGSPRVELDECRWIMEERERERDKGRGKR